jgi:hypothetical protein
MSLPLSLDDVKTFTCDAAQYLGECIVDPFTDLADYHVRRLAQQAEWAHLLAVEVLWLHESSQSTITEWARYYARKKHWQASLAAYNAEFNPSLAHK